MYFLKNLKGFKSIPDKFLKPFSLLGACMYKGNFELCHFAEGHFECIKLTLFLFVIKKCEKLSLLFGLKWFKSPPARVNRRDLERCGRKSGITVLEYSWAIAHAGHVDDIGNRKRARLLLKIDIYPLFSLPQSLLET